MSSAFNDIFQTLQQTTTPGEQSQLAATTAWVTARKGCCQSMRILYPGIPSLYLPIRIHRLQSVLAS